MFSVELYGRVRNACHVEGLSLREAARRFGLHCNTVRKMLAFAVPPGYRRRGPPARPRLGPFTAVIDRILEEDRSAPTSSGARPSGSTSVCAPNTASPAATP